MREMFQHTEPVGRNICGVRWKMQVDPSRVKKNKRTDATVLSYCPIRKRGDLVQLPQGNGLLVTKIAPQFIVADV